MIEVKEVVVRQNAFSTYNGYAIKVHSNNT